MNWIGLETKESNCYRVDIVEMDNAKLETEFIECLNRYVKEVVPKNSKSEWEYLHLTLKGPDGFMEIWPEKFDSPPLKDIFWVSILMNKLAISYDQFSEDELGEKARNLDTSIAKLFISAAESIHLNEGVKKERLVLRFHVYDNEKPFYQGVIGK